MGRERRDDPHGCVKRLTPGRQRVLRGGQAAAGKGIETPRQEKVEGIRPTLRTRNT